MLVRILQAILVVSAVMAAGLSEAAAQSVIGVERAGQGFYKRLCSDAPAAGHARCHGEIATDQAGRPLAAGLRPFSRSTLGAVPYFARDLWSAYYGTITMPAVPAGARPTVAVVAAYGYGQAATDLATYRQLNNLPPLCTATLTTGCVRFTKLNQSGVAGNYPMASSSWAQEQALDVQMVSAMCPWCNIVLVQANSASYANLGKAVLTASAFPGVIAISNSYGGSETGSSLYSAFYSPVNTITNGYAGKLPVHIAVTVSSGDSAYAGGTEFPSSAPYVLSVGGTSLTYNGSWSQTAWAKAGSGCSKIYSQMAWQSPVLPSTACVGRVASDVSAVADINTGVFVVYRGSYFRFGGTSVGAPIIAGIIAQRNVAIRLTLSSGTVASSVYPNKGGTTVATGYGRNLYAQRGALRDVTSGSTGTCAIGFLCKAGPGYDGPTGLGTPNVSLAPF
ncbi:peptidase S8 [Aestuariivirga litoralis]|uniref:Peptidase S8 n=1 Tax=Aestuariivirga litoralis TaxID=2650924 RepID=A0A2W2BK72_9HYPH|nr:peptidase S8 [Aestuariivirga litoralis]PZF76609.1 peptidase S8 [Aestuariivirga litoralis]